MEVRNMQYYTCERCGANLDPGEKCDCENEKEKSDENEEKTE